MGRKFATVSFLQILAPELSDRVLKDFLDIESNVIVNIHVQSVDQVSAIKTIKRTITDLDKTKIEEQKKAVRAGYDMDILPSDLATYGEEAKKLLCQLAVVLLGDGIGLEKVVVQLPFGVGGIKNQEGDQEGEYYPLIHRLGGQVIKISPTSHRLLSSTMPILRLKRKSCSERSAPVKFVFCWAVPQRWALAPTYRTGLLLLVYYY